MRRLFTLAFAALMVLAVSCNSKDRLRLEQLQDEMEALRKSADGIAVPAAADVIDPAQEGAYAFAFDKSCYGVDAGSSVTIHYTLPVASKVEVSTKDDWSATVSATSDTEGDIVISVPDPACSSEVVATAISEDGLSTAAVLPVMVRNPYSDATRPRLGALGYYSLKPWNATVENFRKLAEAGLTMVTMEYDEGDAMEQIDYAAEAGLQVLMIVGGITGRYWEGTLSRQQAVDMIGRFKSSPAICGWHICDEPSVNDAPKLKFMKDFMEEQDSRPVYVNLHPLASSGSLGVDTYYEYVNYLADYLNFDLLSFDIYPIVPGGVMPQWHMCLRTVSDAARRCGIPFWAFAASCWINKETLLRERPNQYNLKLQVYTNLAYGAQAVQYFTIQDYGGTDFAPIMRDGTWTQAYDYLKEANLEMQKRAFVFKDSYVRMVRQIGPETPQDLDLAKYELPAQIGDIRAGGSATVSFIENNGNEYVAVVNNFWNVEQEIAIELNAPAYCIDSDAAFTLCEAGTHGFTLPKGGMLVFKYK